MTPCLLEGYYEILLILKVCMNICNSNVIITDVVAIKLGKYVIAEDSENLE